MCVRHSLCVRTVRAENEIALTFVMNFKAARTGLFVRLYIMQETLCKRSLKQQRALRLTVDVS